MTNLASIGANLIEALRGIAKGSGRHDRVPFTRADGTKDFGRTVAVGEALSAASQHLPDDHRFTEDELVIVDAACAKLGIARPSDKLRAVANAVGKRVFKQ